MVQPVGEKKCRGGERKIYRTNLRGGQNIRMNLGGEKIMTNSGRVVLKMSKNVEKRQKMSNKVEN